MGKCAPKPKAQRFAQRFCNMPAGVLFDVIERAHGLTDTDLRVMAALGTMSDSGGWIRDTRQGRIAERCGFKRSAVNRSIARLEKAGWLQKVDPGRPSGVKTYLILFDRRPLDEGPDAPAGEAEPPVEQGEDEGGVSDGAQGGGVTPAEHTPPDSPEGVTPCVASEHTVRKLSSSESPLPPLAEAGDPVRPSCAGPEGRCASGRDRGPEGEAKRLSSDQWRETRSAIRARIGADAWTGVSGPSRLRLAEGLPTAPSAAEARAIADRYGAALKAAGLIEIFTEDGQGVRL
jgi:predicted transcriptional regulator